MSNETPLVDADGGGGGGGAAGSGSLTGMWRDVYRKAGDVAERIGRSLVDSHVYHYHRAPAGGAAGAGWVLLERRVVAAGGNGHFDGLPTTYRDLRFVVDGRVAGSGTAQEYAIMQLNGYAGIDGYRSVFHLAYGIGGATGHNAGGASGTTAQTDYYALVGRMPGSTATNAASWGLTDLVLYDYALTDRYTQYLSTSSMTGDKDNGATRWQFAGEFLKVDAVSSVHLMTATGDSWATGTVFRVYGWSDGA